MIDDKDTVPREHRVECRQCGYQFHVEEGVCPHCGSPFKTSSQYDPLIGTRIRDYHVQGKLGEGGMGRTYLTRHTHLGSYRVLKIMHPWVAQHPDFPERFRREAQLLANLHHPAIVTLHEFSYLEDGTAFMVMEYLKGETLAEYIKRKGALPEDEAISYIKQLAQGLQFAHSSGIIHRDISPENIILVSGNNGETTVKLIDFGIAKVFSDPTPASDNEDDDFQKVKTRTGMYVGKPGYGSPEQFRQFPGLKEVDGRTDIFSLGIVIYEMLTGKQLFSRESITAYLMTLIHYSEKGPGSLPWQSLSEHYTKIVTRCIAYKPEDRFPSFEHFLDNLEGHTFGLDEELSQTTNNDNSIKEPEQKKKIKPVFWIAIFLIALIVSFSLKKIIGPHSEPVEHSPKLVPTMSDTREIPVNDILPSPTVIDKSKITELLEKMDGAFQKKHYTLPEEGSAYTTAMEILAIDPENKQVSEMLANIIDYYRKTGSGAMSVADFDKAQMNFTRALKIKPEDPDLILLFEHAEHMNKTYATQTIRGIKLVLIPGGSFQMGAVHNDSEAFSDELPQHHVVVSPFYMMTTEMTNRLYLTFCKETETPVPDDPEGFPDFRDYINSFHEYPVINVSWNDAVNCAKFYGLRLPSEAEWEYASRSGYSNNLYPWGNNKPTHRKTASLADDTFLDWKFANSYQRVFSGYDDGYMFTAPVASFPANSFGLFDMGGNVREWCNDYYLDTYYQNSPGKDPKGPDQGSYHIIRGGSWSSSPRTTRCSFRQKAINSQKSSNYGFRLAMDFNPKEPLDLLPKESTD